MRAPLAVMVAMSVTAPPLAACMGSPQPQQQVAAASSGPGHALPKPYEGPLTGKESVAWVQPVGAGTKVAEFTFFVYVDGEKRPLPGAECHLLDGSRHHVCQAPLPELSPGRHTLRFEAVRVVQGKEHASRLSEPLVVMRSLERSGF